MTSFAFILGCVPLARANGGGALSRQVMGYVAIVGVLAASLIASGKRQPIAVSPPNTALAK